MTFSIICSQKHVVVPLRYECNILDSVTVLSYPDSSRSLFTPPSFYYDLDYG